MASRILALLIWAAVAASLAFWGLRLTNKSTAIPANTMAVSLDNAVRGDLRKLLVAPETAEVVEQPSSNSVLAGRLKLLGVVAPRQADEHSGVALLSVDGKPPRAVRVGTAVDGDMILLAVTQRGADIGPAAGPATVKLDLPALPAAATGVLSPPTGISTQNYAPPAAGMGGANNNSSMANSPEGLPLPPTPGMRPHPGQPANRPR
ncbi:MAG: hypothetical protein V4532_07225 [Pseudomonadota bacterium]